MKAAVLVAPMDIKIKNIPKPICDENQVLVQISHMGICGTDTKIFNGEIPANMPLVQGHEAIGKIIEGQYFRKRRSVRGR